MLKPFRISVMISGGGTTLKNLIDCKDRGELDVEIAQVISNKAGAGGIEHAKDAGIPVEVIPHGDFDSVESFSDAIFDRARLANVDLIVMGGFLRRLKIPADFENRVINIHPSLIPAFCGKGNYGSRVHQAVVDYGCKISGCTVHFVDDQYDHGPIIGQATVPVEPADDAKALAARVFVAECEIYPRVINAIAGGKIKLDGRLVAWA